MRRAGEGSLAGLGAEGPSLLPPRTAGVQPMPLPEWVLPKLYASGLMSRSSVLPNPQPLSNPPTGAWNSVQMWKALSLRELVIIRENSH